MGGEEKTDRPAHEAISEYAVRLARVAEIMKQEGGPIITHWQSEQMSASFSQIKAFVEVLETIVHACLYQRAMKETGGEGGGDV